jgi:hypothetical protein
MYNAQATTDNEGSFGSTRLHMDMSDAMNIMTHACATPCGAPGYAIWDIFKAGDAGKLRRFLRARFSIPDHVDPIHAQKWYLDAALRRELHAQEGVVSHRIYQVPGQAVFIPAGCAHQVCRRGEPLLPSLLTNCPPGRERRGLCEGRGRLRQPREHRALRDANARVPRAEPGQGVEGGRAPAPDYDVVRLALLLPRGEAAQPVSGDAFENVVYIFCSVFSLLSMSCVRRRYYVVPYSCRDEQHSKSCGIPTQLFTLWCSQISAYYTRLTCPPPRATAEPSPDSRPACRTGPCGRPSGR